MPAMPMQFAGRPQRVLARIVPDRRRHTYTCTAMTLFGRFMRASKEDYANRTELSETDGRRHSAAGNKTTRLS
jgi:hypothetical protein